MDDATVPAEELRQNIIEALNGLSAMASRFCLLAKYGKLSAWLQ